MLVYLGLLIPAFGLALAATALFAKNRSPLFAPEHLRELIGGFAGLKERLGLGEVRPRLTTALGLEVCYRLVEREDGQGEHRFEISEGGSVSYSLALMVGFVLAESLGIDPLRVAQPADVLTPERTSVGALLSAQEHAAWRSKLIATPTREELEAISERNFATLQAWRRLPFERKWLPAR